ncbi:MAG: hypothetical protein ACYC6O_06630 [Thermoleophilia bacterium]
MKRITQIVLIAAATLLILVGATGCGGQTEQANALVEEVNAIAAVVEPKLDQADKMLLLATDQLSQGKIEEEKASLTQAQSIIDGIIGDIRTAKAKTDEAAAMDISDTYRQYLQAKSRALDEALNLNQTSREITVLLLADPAVEKPETLTKLGELEKTATEQSNRLKAADDEASRIAAENADEIKE